MLQKFPELSNILRAEIIQKNKIQSTKDLPQTSEPKESIKSAVKLDNLSSHLSQAEWVLKTQTSTEHKMFDSSISGFFETNILISPSKRKSEFNHEDDTLINYINIENIFRMTGITFFAVVDPSDIEKIDGNKDIKILNEMIGIRLEIFNEVDHIFEVPYYILLKRNIKHQGWDLFKHTIPKYINLETLLKNTYSGLLITDEQVYIFAKKCYQRLLVMHQRLQYFQNLSKNDRYQDIKIDMYGITVTFNLKLRNEELLECHFRLKDYSVESCSIKMENSKEWEKLLVGPLNEVADKLLHIIHSI